MRIKDIKVGGRYAWQGIASNAENAIEIEVLEVGPAKFTPPRRFSDRAADPVSGKGMVRVRQVDASETSRSIYGEEFRGSLPKDEHIVKPRNIMRTWEEHTAILQRNAEARAERDAARAEAVRQTGKLYDALEQAGYRAPYRDYRSVDIYPSECERIAELIEKGLRYEGLEK